MGNDGFQNNDGFLNNEGNEDLFKHMILLTADDSGRDFRDPDVHEEFGGGAGILTDEDSQEQFYSRETSRNWMIFTTVMLAFVVVELVILFSFSIGYDNERSINRATSQRILRYEAAIKGYNSPPLLQKAGTVGSDSSTDSDSGSGSDKDDETDSRHFLENSLKSILSPSQLVDLTKSFWVYELSINGEILPIDAVSDGLTIEAVSSSGYSAARAVESPDPGADTTPTDAQSRKVIKVMAGDVTVKFSQVEKLRSLPVSLHSKGALGGTVAKDSFNKHLIITSKVNADSNTADGVASYFFKDIKAGQSIELSPDSVLRSYIG